MKSRTRWRAGARGLRRRCTAEPPRAARRASGGLIVRWIGARRARKTAVVDREPGAEVVRLGWAETFGREIDGALACGGAEGVVLPLRRRTRSDPPACASDKPRLCAPDA